MSRQGYKPARRNFVRCATTAVTLALMLLATGFGSKASQAAMLDPSFGVGGLSLISPSARIGSAHGLTIDSSGRMIVVGRTMDPSDDFYAARLLPDGSLDGSFGAGGLAETEIGSASYPTVATANAVAVQQNGKILVAGRVKRVGDRGRASEIALARFDADGSVDLPFSGGAGSWKRYEQGYTATAIAQGRGGKFLLAGAGRKYSGPAADFGLVSRHDADGTLDPTFNARGRSDEPGQVVMAAAPRHSINLRDMILIGRGRILVAGNYGGKFMVARLGRDGRYDRSFGRRGFVTSDVDRIRSCKCGTTAYGMARNSRGKILVAGYSRDPRGGRDYLVVTRFRANGKPDRSFGRGGIAKLRLARGISGYDIAVQRDGRIVVAGQSDDRLAVVRFTPDGRLDRTFFHNGLYLNAALDATMPPVAHKVLIDGAGRIVVAGGDDYTGYAFVLRLLPNARG